MSPAITAQAIRVLLELLPILVGILRAALDADDPRDALIKARAAARMAAIKKGRDQWLVPKPR